MHGLVRTLQYLNLVAFTALALLAARQWLRQRLPVTFWAALAFGALAAVTIVGQVLPKHPGSLVEHTVLRLDIALLVVFPYLLYRFTTTFDPPSRLVNALC